MSRSVARFPGILAPAAAVAALVAVACFSERSAEPGDTGLTCARAGQPPGPDTAFVVIQNFAFNPQVTQVAPGTTVVWINCETSGTPSHTSTADDGSWNSPLLSPGQSFAEVPASGQHAYHCTPHPFMQGEVRVQ